MILEWDYPKLTFFGDIAFGEGTDLRVNRCLKHRTIVRCNTEHIGVVCGHRQQEVGEVAREEVFERGHTIEYEYALRRFRSEKRCRRDRERWRIYRATIRPVSASNLDIGCRRR